MREHQCIHTFQGSKGHDRIFGLTVKSYTPETVKKAQGIKYLDSTWY